jgi:hypothetical protein
MALRSTIRKLAAIAAVLTATPARADGPLFVPAAQRIATFGNDGTLWCEQPVYVQAFFVRDRVKELAARDPGLKD